MTEKTPPPGYKEEPVSDELLMLRRRELAGLLASVDAEKTAPPEVEYATMTTSPEAETVSDRLSRLRASGWSVAVHNDYAITLDDGFTQTRHPNTFWLFTHPSGVWAKGEAETDAEAIAIAEQQATERLQSRRAAQLAGEVERLREALKAFVDYHDRLAGMSVDELLLGDGTSEPELRERGRAALKPTTPAGGEKD